MKPAMFLAGAALLFPLAGFAQVEARQATEAEAKGQNVAESVEVPSPMLLEIGLGADERRKSLADPGVSGRTYYDTKKFVCDKAQVPKVTVMKRVAGSGIELEVTPTITSEWPRQDIDVTLALIAGGKEVQRKFWDDLTVGADDSTLAKMGSAFASQTKMPSAVFRFKKGEFEKLFEGEAPKLRLILDIQD